MELHESPTGSVPFGPWLLGSSKPAAVEHAQGDPSHSAARDVVAHIGELIWSAADQADLEDRLDSSLDDARLVRVAREEIVPRILRGAFEELPNFQSFLQAVAVLANDEHVPDLLEVARVRTITGRLFERPHPTPFRTGAPGQYSLPTPVLDAMLGGARSAVCFSAFADMALEARRPPPWLVRATARLWLVNERSFLRVVLLSYGSDEDVPEDVLPRQDRFDGEAILKERAQDEARFEEFIAKANSGR